MNEKSREELIQEIKYIAGILDDQPIHAAYLAELAEALAAKVAEELADEEPATIINTGKIVKLSELIKSGELIDRSLIQIFDPNGKFITKGPWYQDNVLGWSDFRGKATQPGTGLTVKFQLV